MDYLAQIRHLHQKPWTIGSDQFMRWTGNRPGVSKFILTREFHDLCNQANLLPILEQDLASVIYGPIYRQHCYQGLFFCEVNWALASSILERLQSLTIPFVDIGRYLEPSSVSRLGRLERVHFNMDSPLHEVTQYPDRPPKETQRMLAIKFAPVVRFVEKHTQLFPGVLKAVSSSQEPLWAPQLLSIVTCCLESIQITISHLLPVLREPRSLTTVPLLLQVLAYPEETDLSRVEEVDICSLKSEEGKAAFAKLRNILQRCRSLRKLRTVSLGAGSFKWAVDERRLAEQQQGQDVLSTAADRLAEERRGTVYRREFRRRGLIRLEEINMSGPIVPVADELRDLMIAFCNTLKSIECICYGASDSRTSRLGNGWVELPALTHLSLGLSTKGSFYDPQLLCHCPNVVSVLLYDKTREYQCEDIKPSLPAQFVRLKSLTLEGMPALSLHPATLHSATKLNNLSLTGKKYGVEEEFYFVAFQGEDNDFTKPYCFIPPKEDIYRSYGIQVDSTYSWTPSVIRPNWTWDWHLPCLVSLTLSSEIAFLFQFRMLQGCPALRALELEIRTFTSSHSRSITDADLFTPTGDQIIAPSLEKLRLHGPWTFTSSSSIAHQFLTGMFPSLVSLSALDWVGLSLRDMVSIVRSMSKPIKELFLESKFALRKDQVELNLFWSNSNYDVEKDVLTTFQGRLLNLTAIATPTTPTPYQKQYYHHNDANGVRRNSSAVMEPCNDEQVAEIGRIANGLAPGVQNATHLMPPHHYGTVVTQETTTTNHSSIASLTPSSNDLSRSSISSQGSAGSLVSTTTIAIAAPTTGQNYMTIVNRPGTRPSQAVNATARAYFREHEQSRSASSTQHSISCPGPGSPPVSLVQFENITLVEYALHKLRWQRLEEAKLPLFIPPMAKANLQALDEGLFPLKERVQEFLGSERQVMLILGDSGAGKSTFNRYLERQLWTAYQNSDPIPLFINLPAIDRPDKDLIREHLKAYSFSEEQIQEMKQYRQFVLICDGYDESQLTVNLHTTNLFNRPGQWNVKMVISCRTQYLGQDYRCRFMPDGVSHYTSPTSDLFQEAVITPFTKEQIKDYVEQYVPLEPRAWTTKDYMVKLSTIPNLMDLVKNPFLLSLSLEALPGVIEGKQDLSAIEITRVQLYDTFVRHWLAVNSRRLQRSALSKEDRDMLDHLLEAGFISMGVDYCTKLASAIFEHQDGNSVVQYVHIKDKRSWRAEFFGPDPETRMLRESSPLSRTGSQFRFLHRSMLEYFLSCAIFKPSSHYVDDVFCPQANLGPTSAQLLATDGPLFKRNLLTEPSVIQFLCERAKNYPEFEKQLLAAIEQSKTDATATTAAANAITILVRAGVRFNGAGLQGIWIAGADLSDDQFDYALFQGADLTGVKFARSWLRQVDFGDAQMDGVRFGELPYLKEHAAVNAVAFSPNGKLFAIALSDGSLGTYDATTWTRIASASDDSMIRLWSSVTGECLFVLNGHENTVMSIAYSADGRRLVSGSSDGTIRVWDPETGTPEVGWSIPNVNAMRVVISADGSQFAAMVGWMSYEIRLVDAFTGEKGLRFDDGTDWLKDIAFSPSEKLIVSSSGDDTVRLWDSSSGQLISRLSGHASCPTACTFSSNGQQIASGDRDGIIRLWEVKASRPSSLMQQLAAEVQTVAYSYDGLSITSKRTRGIIQQWNSSTGASKFIPSPPESEVSSVMVSPNGHWFAMGCWDGFIHLWNVQTDVFERALFGSILCPISDMDFSPCGRWLVSCDYIGVVRLWDLESTDDQCKVVSGKDDQYSENGSVVFSPVGDQIAVGLVLDTSRSSRIRLFDPQVTGLPHLLKEVWISGTLHSMDYSPDGRRLILGTGLPWALLWDLQSDKPNVTLEGHTEEVMCVAYSSCGKWILSGSWDRTVRLWSGEVDSWTSVAVVTGCSKAVTSVAWNPVVPMEFVTGSNDGSVRVWRISNAEAGDVLVHMHWGSHIGQLCAAHLTFKGAVGLSPTYRKLLIQRGAISDSQVPERDEAEEGKDE
ncbi:MAG: hypothetical protein JOS17DRAFT_833659 [Linnemannia elongata]|nr:MAG: hypothetical protein JOS17DRAFT_833659 [Linnemannia elongata]